MIIKIDPRLTTALKDKEFLRQLDEYPHKEKYARITSLTWDEMPIEQIEGKVTAGTGNLDGGSAVRRTCSLTLEAQSMDIHDYYWGLKTKFKLEIGLANVINSQYPDIIWFNQGIYIITQFNSSVSPTGYTFSISGKDKMCLLDGSMGGNLPSSIDFGSEDVITYVYKELEKNQNPSYCWVPYEYIGDSNDNLSFNNFKFRKMVFDKTKYSNLLVSKTSVLQCIKQKQDYEDYLYDKSRFPFVFKGNLNSPVYYCFTRDEIKKKEQIPIKTIIKEAVHKYANEPYHNIIISNLDITGQELLEYKGDSPAYLFYNLNSLSYDNISFYGTQIVYIYHETNFIEKQLKELKYKTFNYLSQTDDYGDEFYLKPNLELPKYQVSKISYGDTIGYRETPLTYAGELIANIGESLTSVLDKIKNMLGEYEYFYNIDGQFIFQRKQTYLNNSWNNIMVDTETIENQPQRKYAMPAVYSKPIQYEFVNNNLFTSINNNPQLQNIKNDFAIWGTRKSISGAEIPIHYRAGIQAKPTTYTNYNGIKYIYDKQIFNSFVDQSDYVFNNVQKEGIPSIQILLDYYNDYIKESLNKFEDEDIVYVSDWRELIYQMAIDNLQNGQKDDFLYKIEHYNPLFHLGKTGYEQYYEDMLGFWRDLYNPQPLDNITSKIYTYYETVYNNQKYRYQSIVNGQSFIYNTTQKYEPDYKINMNYTLIQNTSNFGNCYLPQRKNNSSNIFYNYVDSIKEGYFCQSPKGAKAFLQLLDGKEITVLNTAGNPLFIKTNELLDDYYEKRLQTYKWKNIQDENIWFMILEDGYYRVIIKEEDTYKYAYSYYWAQTKNNNIFYTSIINDGVVIIDPRDIYFDPIENGYSWNWSLISDSQKIKHTSIVKEVETNKNYDAITHFNTAITTEPELLNFWFDLIEPNETSEFNNYKIEAIGVRSKAINDQSVKAIYYKDTPNIMFINKKDWNTLNTYKTGYTYIQIPDYYTKYFSISSQGKTAKEALDDMLYQFTSYNESISLTSIPIYHLELNGLIQIADRITNINGDYIVNRITLPLAYNGMMNINASRAIKRII